MVVNKLRTNQDPSVAELAKEIVAKWKKDVHQKAKPSSATSSSVKSPPVSRSSPATTSTPATPPKPSGSKPKVDPANRSRKADGANCDVTSDKVRNNCVGLLYDGMCLESDIGMFIFTSLPWWRQTRV